MATAIVCIGEKGEHAYDPRPIGTTEGKDSAEALALAQTWCQWQANQDKQDVLPLIEWKHYLSRGTGPGTSHYTGETEDWKFEIWFTGVLARGGTHLHGEDWYTDAECPCGSQAGKPVPEPVTEPDAGFGGQDITYEREG